MAQSNIYNSIEQELWRIFTFYALHSDPTQPETIRPANFLRFAKDVQIVSKRLTAPTIELEITRHARTRVQHGTQDYTLSISLTFADFMQLLEHLSTKVYPKDPADVAVKRLILENVLLLANRRIPTNHLYDLQDKETKRLLQQPFRRGLQGIFHHYLSRAEQRRNAALSLEKTRQREVRLKQSMDLNAKLPPEKEQLLQDMKAAAKAQRDMISYKEYLQFCQDFNLKSSSMLTAIQVGEIFLNIIPLDATSSAAVGTGGATGAVFRETGMTFEVWCEALVYMAQVAYRDFHPLVPTHFKLKALLLYMYKVVIDGSRRAQQLGSDRSSSALSSGGSSGTGSGSASSPGGGGGGGVAGTTSALHLFGSGAFTTAFQKAWQQDGYIDYTKVPEGDALSGTSMLRKVVGESEELSSAVDATDKSHKSLGGTKGGGEGEGKRGGEGGDGGADDTDSVAGASVPGTVASMRSTGSVGCVGGLGGAPRQGGGGVGRIVGGGAAGWGLSQGGAAGEQSSTLALSPSDRVGFSDDPYLLQAWEGWERGGADGSGLNSGGEGAHSAAAATAGVHRPPFPLPVAAEDLQELFARRPELTEFLHLEIQAMKLQTAKLTKAAAAVAAAVQM